jgi:hypothetical protein
LKSPVGRSKGTMLPQGAAPVNEVAAIKDGAKRINQTLDLINRLADSTMIVAGLIAAAASYLFYTIK